MQLSAQPLRTIDFPIGDKVYSVRPVGVAVGLRLAEIFSAPQKQTKMTQIDLFKLVLGPVWDEMVTDGVPFTLAWRVGLCTLAREQALLNDSGPDRWENADERARLLWEAGVNPEALAASKAATTPQATGAAAKRSTPPAAATTTRTSSSGTTTKTRKTSAKSTSRARPSRSSSSGASGR